MYLVVYCPMGRRVRCSAMICLSLMQYLLLYFSINLSHQIKNIQNTANSKLCKTPPLFVTSPNIHLLNRSKRYAFWNKSSAKNPNILDVTIGKNTFKFAVSLLSPRSVVKKELLGDSSTVDGSTKVNEELVPLKIYTSEDVAGEYDGILGLDFISKFNVLYIPPDSEIKFNPSVDFNKHIAFPLDDNFAVAVKDSNNATHAAVLSLNASEIDRESSSVEALKTEKDWIFLSENKKFYFCKSAPGVALDLLKLASKGAYIDAKNHILYIETDDDIFKPVSVEETAAAIKIALESGKTTFKQVKQSLVSKGIPIYNCKTPDDIILLAAKLKIWGEKKLLESIEETFDTLPENTPNCGASTVSAYRSESQLLRRAVKINPSLVDSIKSELDYRGIDYKDCKNPDSLADRLAYSRVFSNSKRRKGGNKLRQGSGPVWNVTRKQIPGGMAQFFSNDGDFGVKFEISDTQNLGDFGDMPGLFGDGIVENIIKQFMGDSPLSFFQSKRVNPFTFDQDMDEREEYENYEQNEEPKAEEPLDETKPLSEELQKLYDRAGSRDIQDLIERANQDDELRALLERASRGGFDSLQKSNISKTGMYLLQKLRDAKLI